MKLSYNAVWDGTTVLVRSYAGLALAIAGVFIFLPSLLVSHFIPQPVATGDEAARRAALLAYLTENWFWLLIAIVTTVTGTLAILSLVLDRRSPTVGEAILRGVAAMPIYMLSMVLVAIGLFLAALIASVPFGLFAIAGLRATGVMMALAMLILLLYVSGRLFPLSSVLAAEQERNPVKAIARSLALTKGNGWAIASLLMLLLLATGALVLAVGLALGTLFLLLLGQTLGGFLSLVVSSAVNSAATAFFALVAAALYRHLSGQSSADAFE